MKHDNQQRHDQLKKLNRELLELYKKHLPVSLNELKQAYKDDDTKSLMFTAHKIMPAMDMMGHKQTAKLLKHICHGNDATNYKVTVERAIDEIEQAITELE